MTNNKIIPELFIKPTETFDHHLNLEDNYRVLFSGKFGIGKTTFLNHYFDQKKDQFNVIHLFPVNYSILENEDIFSYMKYDILISLFDNHEYPLKPDYYSFLKDWDGFMLNNIGQVIATAMLLIPKMGKQLNQFVNELRTLTKDFKKYKDSKKDKEMDEISTYLSQFHQAEGGIYETNIITLLIQEWLKDIRNSDKENILIIDDLDRIDPNHIFRLLNVFSAHFDSKDGDESKNKFGFDKVIFVCDVENIKSIYHSQYGMDTDFNGYVDKFYSKEVYKFDNRENLLSIIDQIIKSITISGHTKDYFHDPIMKTINIHKTLTILVQHLVSSNKINLRSLFKFYNQKIVLPKSSILVFGEELLPAENYFLTSIHILSSFVGDLGILKNKISKLKHLHVSYKDHPALFIGNLVHLKDSHNATEIKRSLYGNASDFIKFNFQLDKKYSGTYRILSPNRESITYSGLLETLSVDENELDINQVKGNIDVIDIVKEIMDNIEF